MKTLCILSGAKVVKSISDLSVEHLVIVHDLVDEVELLEEIFPQLVRNGTVPNSSRLNSDCLSRGYQESRTKFVYSSWLADTISAAWVAPLQKYSLGFC